MYKCQLKKWIKSNHLTQREVGKIIGRSRQTVADYLHGRRRIPSDVSRAIHNYHGLSNTEKEIAVSQYVHYLVNSISE